MRQVVVIHGGDAFPTYEAYLQELKDKKIESADRFKPHTGWKDTLGEQLGTDYEVFLPQMPCKQNAKYVEWKIWFEKLIPFLEDGVVLVGHSLGGIFLAKYLSEEEISMSVRATLLLAAPFKRGHREHISFRLSETLSLFSKQGGKIFLYHSEDDSVVPFSEFALYQAALPDATTRIFTNRDHFFAQDTFPELVADVKSL